LYERGGEIAGVDDISRHMRFSTLGYSEEKINALRELEERKGSIDELRGDKVIEMEREVTKAEIMDEVVLDDEQENEEQNKVGKDMGDR
jgi:hypothetical protein